VLDNCEHLLDAVAPLVSRVLRRCPTVRVLATSREPLGLPGEITWSLPPLPVPVSTDVPLAELRESPAVVLFTARARAARPGFAVGEDNRRDVAEICIRLDGVPLALELAAARIRSLTSADLAARLDERFRLLAGIRGVDPRHHALIDVVTWSHDLLTPSEQELFVRLSVFAGGFDLQRAEEVCSGGGLALSEVAALLAALVDKSMVVATEWAGRMRYRLLETLRAFARDRLEAGADATPRYLAHAHSYLETAREAGRALDGPGERGGVAHLEENFEDLREAFWRSLALGELDTALGFVAAVREFAFRTLREEVFGWAEAASSAPGAGSRPLYPVVRAVVAYGVFTRGALREASEVALDAVEAADRLGAPTGALAERVLGNTHFHRGETDEALHWMDRMIVAAESSGEEAFVAHARYMSSVARTSVDDPHGARQAAAACRAAAERCGAPTALAQADYAEALLIEHDDPDRAITLLQRSVASAGLVSNRWLRAFARTEELFARARRGELTAALDGFGDVVETWFRGGDWPNQWLSLRHLFGVFVEQGEDELAGVLHGAIEAAGATIALPFQPANAARASGLVDVARIHYGAEAFDAAVTRGRAMRDEEVVRLVLRHLGAPRW
jgi:predicted ATPase